MKKHISTTLLTTLLLLIFFAQGIRHIRNTSITFDEGPHLAVGYTTLRTGDFRLQPIHIHPPLANVLAAAPLLLQNDLPDPRTIDGWEIASLSAITDTIVWQYPHPERLAFAGRLPILWLAVLLGALVYRWARDLGGTQAGLFALALYAFDPNLIAHGTLITTDIAAACFIVATLYAASRRVSGDFVGWIGVGVLLGLALLAKVSTALLVPVLGLIILSYELRTENFHVSRFAPCALRLTLYALCLALPAALVLWAGYGFEIGGVAGLPFPIPAATHIRIYQSLQEHYDLGHPTFLMGQVSSHGWWWYFPVAFALKTPLAVLLLGLYSATRSAYCIVHSRFTHHPSHFTFYISHFTLYVFPLLYTLTSLFSTVNIGYRHLLPLLPFLYIGIANSVWRKMHGKWQITHHKSRLAFYASRFPPYGLLAWLMLGTLHVAPNYLAFFNELAGGPAGGYRYLVDSNLDWGQNLWELRDWMTAHNEEHIYYAHYSPARPQVYGINADFLPPDPRAMDFTPWQPAPGLYAIGATVLQGPYAPEVNTYAWFRGREPAAQLGHALFLYQVEAATPPAWALLCAETGISPETARANLGQPTLRTLQPDCAQAQVYAEGAGISIVAPENGTPVGTQEFALRAADGTTRAKVYRIATAPAPENVYRVTTDGPLDFLGYDMAPLTGNTEIELRTYWQVKYQPARPLSLMAHLVTSDGTTVGVGDGMGFPIDQWQPGDIIVQQHHLPRPEGVGNTFHIGGYWLDSLERWTIEGNGDYWEVAP